MNDHEKIYLQPPCCADPDVGRLWSETPEPEYCEEGNEWTEYVRADLAESPRSPDCYSLTPEDITVGFGTFKAGVKFETVKRAVDRHNAIYRELLRITPTDVTNEIVDRLNRGE